MARSVRLVRPSGREPLKEFFCRALQERVKPKWNEIET